MSNIIEEVKKIDDELYRVTYQQPDLEKAENLWRSIKGDFKLLQTAMQVVKSKYYERDTFLATAIVECMLIDYPKADEDPNQLSLIEDCTYASVYKSLVDKIYSNSDLARIVLDGYSNGGNSFLFYTLLNNGLKLNDEQRAFAIEEAMNKIGTTKYSKQMADFEKELDAEGVTDKITVVVPEFGPIGKRTLSIYVTEMLMSMDRNQAHGRGEFDIRYYILKNHNFADKMQQLIHDFFASAEEYDAIIEYWEWNIVNLCQREDVNSDPIIYLDEIMFIREEEVFRRLSSEQANEIMDEINFIRKLRELRPMQWELAGQKKKLVPKNAEMLDENL